MTMHLAHPGLTLSGHRKGKQKWTSAEQKRKAQELEQAWNSKLEQYKAMSRTSIYKPATRSAAALAPKIPPGRTSSKHIPSIDSGHQGAVASKAPQMYTGTKMIGIGTLHKSNAVPIFSDNEAKEISSMRR